MKFRHRVKSNYSVSTCVSVIYNAVLKQCKRQKLNFFSVRVSTINVDTLKRAL